MKDQYYYNITKLRYYTISNNHQKQSSKTQNQTTLQTTKYNKNKQKQTQQHLQNTKHKEKQQTQTPKVRKPSQTSKIK